MAKTSRSGSDSVRKSLGEKNTALMHALIHATPRVRKALIQHADKNLIRCICECALNLLHGNIPLRDCEKSK